MEGIIALHYIFMTFYVPAVSHEQSYLYANYAENVFGICPNSTKNLFLSALYIDYNSCQKWCEDQKQFGFKWEPLEVEINEEELNKYLDEYRLSLEIPIK